jgi:hypothetical protein
VSVETFRRVTCNNCGFVEDVPGDEEPAAHGWRPAGHDEHGAPPAGAVWCRHCETAVAHAQRLAREAALAKRKDAQRRGTP